ncbi:SHOCT domain-containing protein [Ferruginibacter albus]|uniref:SHOCT domain-containing protein n=1 Tax=Ferruginibacter albus TaxID=2875540 RepID=UPI001CC7F162|nr:SHOCT domain-containing protein [Ferruginibacter albus]UAY53447.1 SHOCT domain-containing protein [Ferruginibacter albus]
MGFFDAMKFPVYTLKYEGGLPGFKPAPGSIQFKNDQAELKIMVGFSRKTILLNPDDIVEVGLDQETYRSAGKAAAGAIVGGILTGGIGLLAGAALGGKRRKENHLHLVVNYNGQECEVLIEPSKDIPTIYTEFKTMVSKQTQKPVLEKPTEDTAEKQSDVTVEIEKLYSLLQKGILTQDEFDTKKKMLLGI